MSQCYICGSRFGDIECIDCNRIICSSCLVQSKGKCKNCSIAKRRFSSLRRNIPYILMFVAIWFFVAGFYPFPYFYAVGIPVDNTIMQPVLIATAIFLIPFVFMMFAWRKKSRY